MKMNQKISRDPRTLKYTLPFKHDQRAFGDNTLTVRVSRKQENKGELSVRLPTHLSLSIST